jgi:dihydrolipoamide dehydrogenase
MSNRYQVAVIGSGSGGREATLLAARQGLKTALIERNKMGGTCFHAGCYAVRVLQACARQFRDLVSSGRFGNEPNLLKTTLSDWMRTQSRVSSRLADGLEAELKQLNVEVHQGHAEFLNAQTLEIIGTQGAKTTIIADNVIVATGSRPHFFAAPMPCLVNSEELLKITTLPGHLAIVGGGYIGCEFASIYRSLGCQVTLLEKESTILSGWESEAGEHVGQELGSRGVTIQLNCDVSFARIETTKTGVCIPVTGGKSVEADLVLVATGRKPNSHGVGLKALGVEDDGFLKVDDKMRLPQPGLYAVGDVNGIRLLDSTAFSQASVAIASILGGESRFDYSWIPRCVHTDPSVAAVGLTQKEAVAEGYDCVAVSETIRLISEDARSIADPEPTFLKIVIEPRSRRLLGCLVVGEHAPAIVNVAAIAMRSGVSIDKLREMPLAQPSASEALMSTLRKLDLVS